MYARNYAKWCMPLSENFAWWMVKRYHNRADLTLVTSPQARLVFCSSRVPSRFDWNRGAPRRKRVRTAHLVQWRVAYRFAAAGRRGAEPHGGVTRNCTYVVWRVARRLRPSSTPRASAMSRSGTRGSTRRSSTPSSRRRRCASSSPRFMLSRLGSIDRSVGRSIGRSTRGMFTRHCIDTVRTALSRFSSRGRARRAVAHLRRATRAREAAAGHQVRYT